VTKGVGGQSGSDSGGERLSMGYLRFADVCAIDETTTHSQDTGRGRVDQFLHESE